MKAITTIILVMILVASCEVNITDKFNQTSGNQIILSGVFSSYDTAKINLSQSITMTDFDSLKFINDAFVEVESGEDSYQMIFSGNGNYKAPNLIIQPGNEYRLRCTDPNVAEVTASVIVPEMPSGGGFTYHVDEEFWLHLDLNIDDPGNAVNYYSLAVSGWRKVVRHHYDFETFERSEDTVNIYMDYTLIFEDAVIQYSGGPDGFEEVQDEDDRGSMLHFSDHLFNGSQHKLSISIPLVNMYNDTIPEVSVRLYNRDQHYFRFVETLSKYNPDPDFPIMQPIQIYSNIEGGFGLLTAESHLEYKIDMSPWFNDPEFLELLNL